MAFTKIESSGISSSINLVIQSVESTSANYSGIVTASSFRGDGSQLTGVSGFGTALSNTQGSLLNLVYKTPYSFTVSSGSSVSIESDATSGYYAYTRLNQIIVSSGATMRIGSGTTFMMNVIRFN